MASTVSPVEEVAVRLSLDSGHSSRSMQPQCNYAAVQGVSNQTRARKERKYKLIQGRGSGSVEVVTRSLTQVRERWHDEWVDWVAQPN